MAISNPFAYGGPVAGEKFAGRTQEVQAVVNRLRDHIGIVVTAPRRYGKTSLIKQACEALTKLEPAPAIVHVNLLRANSMTAFSELLLQTLYQVPGGSWRRLKDGIQVFARRIRLQPSITFDESGKPTFAFSAATAPKELSGVLDDVYKILHEIGSTRPAVLVLDEFQAAIDLDSNLPSQLKGLADQYTNVSLVLAGSKQHIMEKLVVSKGAPLYNMLEQIALGPIPEADWVPFLRKRALKAGLPFDSEITAKSVFTKAGPVPFDVHQLAYEAFNQATAKIDEGSVSKALTEIVNHRSSNYSEKFSNYSEGQRRILKELASGSALSVGSSEFATRVGLADATSVRKSLQGMREAELVVRRNGKDCIDDPFFVAWLCNSQDDL